MATIPRILPKKPEPPKPPPVRTYTLEQMHALGWISDVANGARAPDPRIPSGHDPRISRED
ncbi:hypothetical protein [Bradyrhizobium japonicum]|uniref:hypothetical protein n=1 Tax=Bradyrhizobium japonicum TaxID=375 RepID=UPI0035159298